MCLLKVVGVYTFVSILLKPTISYHLKRRPRAVVKTLNILRAVKDSSGRMGRRTCYKWYVKMTRPGTRGRLDIRSLIDRS
ncbi:hypothetical protein BD769DRAFT_1478512 [Suillus cothurnatus]|nr:hypothetical protein BD769DRAFT_1478512 [Suillus cothurnatus]